MGESKFLVMEPMNSEFRIRKGGSEEAVNAVEMSPQIDDDSMGDLRVFLPSVSEIQCFKSEGKAIGWPRHKNKANNNRHAGALDSDPTRPRDPAKLKTPLVIACMKGQEPNLECLNGV